MWKVERDAGRGWLQLTCHGSLTRQDCTRATRQVLELMTPQTPQGVLVDLRDAVCELGVGDLYAVPAMWTHGEVDRASALALLVAPTSMSRSDAEFFENTCRNRGWNVRAFDEHAAAVTWLAAQFRAGEAASTA